MTACRETDAALARRAAAGDERAFADLVTRHKAPLYRLLRRYAGDPEEAYEAAHEAFIAAWSSIGRYDPERPFLAWLRAIAINKARDRQRRMTLRRLVLGAGWSESRVHDRPDPAAPADAYLMEQERAAQLDRAIAGLPNRLKEALLLTAFEGLSHQEAGDVLGVTAKTIETRVYRARKMLAAGLDADLRP